MTAEGAREHHECTTRFAVVRRGRAAHRDAVAQALVGAFEARGHRQARDGEAPTFVVHLTSADRPHAFRRRDASVAVLGVVEGHGPQTGWEPAAYTTLIRTLSNVLVWLWPPTSGNGAPSVGIATPEAGFTRQALDPDELAERLAPIVTSHFAIANDVAADIDPVAAARSEVVAELCARGRELAAWGVLPVPFPLEEVLPPRDLRQLRRLFGLNGLSYGNLSARDPAFADAGRAAFWMTGRGVDKARLAGAGRDLLLVTGLAAHAPPCLSVRVPVGTDRNARASVDAIEHLRIYERFPAVGAIVHVHAWLPGLASTRQVHPCGTVQLADEVVAGIARQPDPAAAVVGLRNHGITATGRDLADVFGRLSGRLVTEVPMQP